MARPGKLAPHAKEIARLYREGYTLREIASQLGCGLKAVWRQLHASGVEARPAGRPIGRGPAQVSLLPYSDTIVGLYLEGWSCHALARRYGVSPNAVLRHLRFHGIAIRRPGKRPRAEIERERRKGRAA